MTTSEFTVHLAAVLKRYCLHHAAYDMMVAVALDMVRRGYSAKPSIALSVGCSFQNVDLRLHRSAELFVVDADHTPMRVTLSAEAQKLLGDINQSIAARAKSAEAAMN